MKVIALRGEFFCGGVVVLWLFVAIDVEEGKIYVHILYSSVAC